MEQSTTIGVISTVVAIFFYGSTYVPVRWFQAGDGIFFQWLMCVGQLLVGFFVYLFDGCPPIHPLAMLGGAFFAIGNAMTIFIMDGLGMAVGSLLWNTVCCIVGWAVSRFGLFWNPQLVPYSDLLNMSGVILVCIGGCVFAPIKHIPLRVRPAPYQFEKHEEQHHLEYPSKTKRIISILLCILVGSLYGNMLTPINYIIEHEGAIPVLHSHFFSFCIGTIVSGTGVLAIYAGVRRNRPFVNPELVLPSIAAGIFYGIATCTMFAANQHLGQVIAYPIISKSPGIVTTLWAVLLFREIQGKWNIIAIFSGIAVTLTGVTMISLSKMPIFG